MTQYTYDVFISYAREDNLAVTVRDGSVTKGWVDAFAEHLGRSHKSWTGRQLKVFLDRSEIKNGEDWEARLFGELRRSRVMIVFLSPAYLDSEYCKLEWETYTRHEHASACGVRTGIKQVHYISVPELTGDSLPNDKISNWVAEINSRQNTEGFDLVDWQSDPLALERMLRVVDAGRALDDLRRNPRDEVEQSLIPLIDRIAQIDASIADTLDNVVLAELAVGRGNAPISYEGFVGRGSEMARLHRALTGDKQVGVVGALHGLGGQGKTALAVQYAHAYSGFYAAGGRWFLNCAGKETLFAVLHELRSLIADHPEFNLPERRDEASEDEEIAALIAELRHLTKTDGKTFIDDEVRKAGIYIPHKGRIQPQPRMLLILDNVDTDGLMNKGALAALNLREDWLEVIVTTRRDPSLIVGGHLAAIPVDDLPPEDALALLRENRPFKDLDDRRAAEELVARIGGMTLVIDLVAAKLRLDMDRRGGATYQSMLQGYIKSGLGFSDRMAESASHGVRARDRSARVGWIVEDTLADLGSHAARTIVELASFFPPDMVTLFNLKLAIDGIHPEMDDSGGPDDGASGGLFERLIADLEARRIFIPAVVPDGAIEAVRLHRHVAEHALAFASVEKLETLEKQVLSSFFRGMQLFEEHWQHDAKFLRGLLPGLATLGMTLIVRFPDRVDLAHKIQYLAEVQFQNRNWSEAWAMIEIANTTLLRAQGMGQEVSLDAVWGTLGGLHLQRGWQGDTEAAVDFFKKSIDENEAEVLTQPESINSLLGLLASKQRLGFLYSDRDNSGDTQLALEIFENCLILAKSVLEIDPDSFDARRNVGAARQHLGDQYIQRGMSGDAEKAKVLYLEALDEFEALLLISPQSTLLRRDLAVVQKCLGDISSKSDNPKEGDDALQLLRASIALLRVNLDENPDWMRDKSALSSQFMDLADLLLARDKDGNAEEALKAYQDSLMLSELILSEDPQSESALTQRCLVQERLTGFFLQRGRAIDALPLIEQAWIFRRNLAEMEPYNSNFAISFFICTNLFAATNAMLGNREVEEQALETLVELFIDCDERGIDLDEKCIAIANGLVKEQILIRMQQRARDRIPDNIVLNAKNDHQFMKSLQERLAEEEMVFDDLDSEMQEHAIREFIVQNEENDGTALLRRVEAKLEHLETRLAKKPDSPEIQRDLGEVLVVLGRHLRDLGRQSEAMPYILQSWQIRKKLAENYPDNVALARDLIFVGTHLPSLHQELGDEPEAQRTLLVLLDLMLDFQVRDFPSDPSMEKIFEAYQPHLEQRRLANLTANAGLIVRSALFAVRLLGRFARRLRGGQD